jgi:hypothetical protein
VAHHRSERLALAVESDNYAGARWRKIIAHLRHVDV